MNLLNNSYPSAQGIEVEGIPPEGVYDALKECRKGAQEQYEKWLDEAIERLKDHE